MPSRQRQLSTKQWSGNKCSAVLTKIQTSSYAMDHRDWPGKQWQAERQACRCTHLTPRFSQTVKPFSVFESLFYVYFVLNVSFLLQYSTLLYRQNRIFVDMSYSLKIAVLSPILSTKCMSTTSLVTTPLSSKVKLAKNAQCEPTTISDDATSFGILQAEINVRILLLLHISIRPHKKRSKTFV